MSENVFVGADSFRRLLLGAAGGYELQGHHEAAETVLHVIDALDELTTGGKGRSQADEDQEAMAAAETVRLYCEKRRKTGCCGESCHCNGYAGRQGFGSNRCTVAETSYMETWIL